MWRRIRRVLIVGFTVCALPLSAIAQENQEDRIKALEERIITLEGQVRMLPLINGFARPTFGFMPAA